MSEDEEVESSENSGTKKPFRDLKTGEIVMRFRGRAGYVPVENGPHPVPPANPHNRNDISDLFAIAMNNLKALELTLKQMGERCRG